MLDEPSSREQSQVPTPFSRNSLELPPQASGSGTSSGNNAPSSEELKAQQLSFCKKLLDHLHKPEFQHFAWFFYNPVRESAVLRRPARLHTSVDATDGRLRTLP